VIWVIYHGYHEIVIENLKKNKNKEIKEIFT